MQIIHPERLPSTTRVVVPLVLCLLYLCLNTDTEKTDQLALFPICTERQTRKRTTDTLNDKKDKYNTRTIKGQRNKNTLHTNTVVKNMIKKQI